MKLLFCALVFWFCCDFSYGVVFDPYTRRYSIRNASFDALFTPSPVASTTIQALVLASTKIDNDRCKSIHQFAVRPTLDQLVSFQYELIDLCPQLYETIRTKNITTWGPIDEFLQIWYMRFVDALWKRISLKMASGRCALYDDFIAAAENDLDVALFEYLENNYNPNLCEVNNETMREWHLFLQRTQVFNRLSKHLKIGGFSLQLVHAIAKAYLTEARYNAYLIGPPYPLITYMNASLSMPNFTLTQKSFFKQTFTALSTAFGPLDLAGRQNYFIMKFCEIIDLSWSYFGVFNMIPMDPLDGITHYHLILYYSRKNFLISKQLEYVAPPTLSTTAEPPVTCPTIPAPSPSTDPTCTAPPGTAGIYLENGVTIREDYYFLNAEPVATCNSGNGIFSYYNGSTSQDLEEYVSDRVWVGVWQRQEPGFGPIICSSPCLCSSTACYVAKKELSPYIMFYPHCTTPNDCFIAMVYGSSGTIVNPLNATDRFDAEDVEDYDVTKPYYPKIIKVGCNGCPISTTPPAIPPTIAPTCTPPPGTAAIFLKDEVALESDPDYPRADPVSTCRNSLNGYTAYYNGSTPRNWTQSEDRIFIGNWVRLACTTPCICTDIGCYRTTQFLVHKINFYPHCVTPNDCFVALVFLTYGWINPYTFVGKEISSENQTTHDVTQPYYPKITSVGCDCPVII